MELVALPLLVAVFCVLVAILFLCNNLRRRAKRWTPLQNASYVSEWLTHRGVSVPLPLDGLIQELNGQASSIRSPAGGQAWSGLQIISLLKGTNLPHVQLLDVEETESNRIVCNVLVEWPDCVPGIEVGVLLSGGEGEDEEKVIGHLQVDWLIMKGTLTLADAADEGVVVYWVQTTPPTSAMSCLIVAPPKLAANMDIMKPLDRSHTTQISEDLASSVTEGVLELLREFHLNGHHLREPVKMDEETVEETVEEGVADDTGSHDHHQPPDDIITNPSLDQSSPDDFNEVGVGDVMTEATPIPIDDLNEDGPSDEIITEIFLPSMDETSSSDKIEPLPMAPPISNGGGSNHWVGGTKLPVIAEPEIEEISSVVEESPLSNSNKTRPSPLPWRRTSSYEQLIKIAPPPAPPTTLTSSLKVAGSEDDILIHQDLPVRPRPQTYSIRSYDSTVTTPNGNLPSTLVYEISEGNHIRHVVAVSFAHAQKLRKQLSHYTKLHIYNDHTFTATHIKGKQLCAVCQEKVSGLFGKQCYICRDCSILVHKECHFRIESPCQKTKVSKMKLIYPVDTISSSPTGQI